MQRSRLRRSGALIVSVAMLASLAVATAATPAAAAGKVSCQGEVATIVGTNGRDVLYGTSGPDVIAGLGGNDLINGRGGNDIICGGPGADRLVGAAGLDRLYGNAGPDRLFGGDGPDRQYGGVGNDLLAGQVGNDQLNGMAGTDTCDQGTGRGAQISCERPDSDGDGVPDHADACPDAGDQGFGLGGDGCPKPPANGWQGRCVPDGGTYREDWNGYDYACTWAHGTSPYATADDVFNVYLPICFSELGGNVASTSLSSDPDYVTCGLP